MVFGGDLNTEPTWPTVQEISLFNTPKLHSVYQDANFTTFKIRDTQYLRVIDYIWYSPNTLELAQYL